MYVSAIQGQHLNWSLSSAKLSFVKEGPHYACSHQCISECTEENPHLPYHSFILSCMFQFFIELL